MKAEFEIKERNLESELNEIQQLALKYQSDFQINETETIEKEKTSILGFFTSVVRIA